MTDESQTEVDADEELTLTLGEGYLPDIHPDFEVITLTPDETIIQDMHALEIGDNLIINYGDAGTEFHALAQVNDYTTLPSGATAWVFNSFDDYLGIPPGSAVDNIGDLTFHWQLYLNGDGGNNAGRLWSKQQQPGSFDVYIDDLENRVVIQRYTIYDIEEWKTPLDSIQRDTWLDIQLAWASGITAPITAVHESNAVVKYSTWPTTGTTITNEGVAGAGYNGTAVDNDYLELPSGATSFSINDESDKIKVPKGAVIDNLGPHTMEFILYLSATANNYTFLYNKRNTANSLDNYLIQIIGTTNSYLRLYREGTSVILWETPASSLVAGNYYTIQIAWDPTITGGTCADPVIKINNVQQTLTKSGACPAAWGEDSGSDAYIWNRVYGAWNEETLGNAILFRLHNRVLTSPELTDNYNTDSWRYSTAVHESNTPAPAATPEVDINNVPQEMEHTLAGTGLWADDTGFGAILGNTSQGYYNLNATVALFRLYKQKLSRGVRKSNYLADLWRWHNPKTGALAVPSDANTPDPDPVLRIGKNVSSIDVQVDYSSVITKLFPRGSGSSPSELNLNWPLYFPSGQKLGLYTTDSKYAYFRVPGPYSAYRQYWGDGTNLPVQYFVGRGLKTYPQNPVTTGNTGVISKSGDAFALVFYPTIDFRIYSVGFYLHRLQATEWGEPPIFTVGLYTTAGSNSSVIQIPGYHVPYQGPMTWCYGNLLSISRTPQWYDFNLQANKYPGGKWYAIVVQPYAPTDTWDKNKGAQYPDGLECMPAASRLGGANNVYAAQTSNGIAPRNWIVPLSGGVAPLHSPYAYQYASRMTYVETDITSQFKQAGGWDQPGRYVKTPIANYVPGAQYIFHYMHTPYLIAWDAYNKYGKVEGNYKNDALTSQDALLAGATEYLKGVSEPVVTISLSAADLYDIDPERNWSEELQLGAPVTVVDEVIGLNQECIISKITKPNLNNPHDIQIQLENVHLNASKLIANLNSAQQRQPKYLQGQTVAAPFNISTAADSANPATMYFDIRDVTQLTHSVKLTITPMPFQVTSSSGVSNISTLPSNFKLVVDGNAVK